jgi:hypothetical protein
MLHTAESGAEGDGEPNIGRDERTAAMRALSESGVVYAL